MRDRAEVLAVKIRHAYGPINNYDRSVTQIAGAACEFIQWIFTESIYALEICPADIMDKLAELKLAEWRDVDPNYNEWEADRLCFLIGVETPPKDKLVGEESYGSG